MSSDESAANRLETAGATLRRGKSGSVRVVELPAGTVLDADLIEALTGLPKLAKLVAAGTRLHDADLASLARLTNLVQLDLQDTPISDAGIESLKRLTKLQWLQLSGTAVSPAGLKSLRQSLMGARILHA